MQPDTNPPAQSPADPQPSPGTRFPVTEKQINEIANRFSYHRPEGSQPERYAVVRDKARELALLICLTSHESREQSLALTKLQEAVMWANAGIACNG